MTAQQEEGSSTNGELFPTLPSGLHPKRHCSMDPAFQKGEAHLVVLSQQSVKYSCDC